MGTRGLTKTVGGVVAAAALGFSGASSAVPHVSVSAPTDAPHKAKKPHVAASHPKHEKHEREEAAPTVERDPAAAAKMKEEADQLRKDGKLEEASKTYEEAYQRDPSNIPLVEDYGKTLYGLNHYKEAADLFKKAASRDEPAAYWNLGYALRKQHDYDGAARAYLQYINFNRDDPDGFYEIAEVYRVKGDKQNAITAYTAYVEKETRPSEQVWVDKAKKKLENLQIVAAPPPIAVAVNVPPPVVVPAPAPVIVAAPPPVVAPAPAPVVVVAAPAPAPVVVAAPAPAPVVVAPAPAPVVVAAPPPVVAPAPAPVVVAAPPPVVVAAPAPAPAPAPVVVAAPPPAPAAPVRDTNGALARVRDGDVAFQAKQYSEALSAYQDAIKLDDHAATAYLKMGLAYANMSRFQDAIDQWHHVLEIEPGNRYAPVFITKAQSHLSTAAAASAPAGVAPTVAAPAPAPVSAAVAQGHPPTDEETASYRRGLQALKQQHYQESLAELSSVIEKNPSYVNAYVARGRAYAGTMDYASGIADYLRALSLNPNMATPLFGLAQAYDKQGSRPAACENYRKYAQSTAPDVQGKLKDMAQAALATCGP